MRQVGGQIFGDAICQIILIPIAAKIGERQHCYGEHRGAIIDYSTGVWPVCHQPPDYSDGTHAEQNGCGN